MQLYVTFVMQRGRKFIFRGEILDKGVKYESIKNSHSGCFRLYSDYC